MKLLFLTSSYPPLHLGGYELTCAETAAWLVARGHEVRVLTSRPGDSAIAPEDEVYRSLWPEADIHFYRPLDFFFRRRRRERANLEVLRSLLGEYSPDVVMVWGMWNLSPRLPELLEQTIPDRTVYYLASYWPTDQNPHLLYWQGRARRWWTELVKKPLRAVALKQLRRDGYPPALRFERSICCSHFVRERLVASGKVPESAQVVHLCVPSRAYFQDRRHASSDGRLRLVFVGRLVADKGTHIAVEALARLTPEDREKLLLTVVGEGHPDYEEMLRRLVSRKDLDSVVRFTGRLPGADVARVLAASDALLFTSLWAEPFARTVQEAMAAGALVIAAEVGGQPEILRHEENALTFEPGNVEQLSSSIRRVLRHRQLATRLARAGQKTVISHFTLDKMGSGIETYLGNLVAGSPPRSRQGGDV